MAGLKAAGATEAAEAGAAGDADETGAADAAAEAGATEAGADAGDGVALAPEQAVAASDSATANRPRRGEKAIPVPPRRR